MIEEELQKLGLSLKEAKVYLAALELGPKSAQEIARHTNINRVTGYVMLDNLIKRGLVSQAEGEKGRVYVAEPPEKLIHYLRTREQELKAQELNAQKILPQLLAIFNAAADKPKVRYFEGLEGIKMFQKMALDSNPKNIDGIVSVDHMLDRFEPHAFDDYRDELLKRKVSGRTILTIKKYTLDYLPKGFEGYLLLRILPYDKFQFPGEIAIFEKFASIFSYYGKPLCIVIEHPAVVLTLQKLFDLAWEGAEKFKINKDDIKYDI